MEEDCKVEEISMGRIIIKRIDLDRIYTETTRSGVIEIPNDDRKRIGGMIGKIELGGRYKLKHRVGEARGNGKIDYRVRILG